MGHLGVRKRKTRKAKKLRTTIRKEERKEKKISPKNASPSYQNKEGGERQLDPRSEVSWTFVVRASS